MKDYIYQFYNEGLGELLYLRPSNFFKNRISNKKIYSVISLLIKILYTIFAIFLAIVMFMFRWPF